MRKDRMPTLLVLGCLVLLGLVLAQRNCVKRAELALADQAYEKQDCDGFLKHYRNASPGSVSVELRTRRDECQMVVTMLANSGKPLTPPEDFAFYDKYSDSPLVSAVSRQHLEKLLERGRPGLAFELLQRVEGFPKDTMDEVLHQLAWSKGSDAKAVMSRAWKAVCEGRSSESPAIGFERNQPGKYLWVEQGRWSKGKVELQLDKELAAAEPALAHFAVCIEEDLREIERCGYSRAGFQGTPLSAMSTHNHIRAKRRWSVTIRDARSATVLAERKFLGPAPDACPDTKSVSILETEEEWAPGDPPDGRAIGQWLFASRRRLLAASS